MGNRFTVSVYRLMEDFFGETYVYVPFWEGESLLRALWMAWQAKRDSDNACVKVEWR